MDSDINIARKANSLPISEIAKNLNIPEESIIPYGNNKAKIDYSFIKSLSNKKNGKLILVTAISPTPAGEGKTTTTVGLGDGLNKIGENTLICLREPSLGPCFGMKGGAAGGGYSQVIPMEDINLHFTGDFHAISSAHNLLSALVDNHIHWDNTLGFDVRRVSWKRVVDMNDRSLRKIVLSLGGVVLSTSVKAAGDKFDMSIMEYMRNIHKLAIGETTAERMKKIIGSACPPEDGAGESMHVKGRDLVTGLPKEINISQRQIAEAISEPVAQIIDTIKRALERIPAELAADIVERGIMLAGGGSLLGNLDKVLRRATSLPISIAEDPLLCVVMGTGKALEEKSKLSDMFASE